MLYSKAKLLMNTDTLVVNSTSNKHYDMEIILNYIYKE